jgi:hypothetical protein
VGFVQAQVTDGGTWLVQLCVAVRRSGRSAERLVRSRRTSSGSSGMAIVELIAGGGEGRGLIVWRGGLSHRASRLRGAPHTALAVVECSHALEIRACPSEPILDLARRPIAMRAERTASELKPNSTSGQRRIDGCSARSRLPSRQSRWSRSSAARHLGTDLEAFAPHFACGCLTVLHAQRRSLCALTSIGPQPWVQMFVVLTQSRPAALEEPVKLFSLPSDSSRFAGVALGRGPRWRDASPAETQPVCVRLRQGRLRPVRVACHLPAQAAHCVAVAQSRGAGVGAHHRCQKASGTFLATARTNQKEKHDQD